MLFPKTSLNRKFTVLQILQSFDKFFVKLRAHLVKLCTLKYFRCIICTSGVRKTCQMTSAKNCIFKIEVIHFTIFFHFPGYIWSQTSQKAVLRSQTKITDGNQTGFEIFEGGLISENLRKFFHSILKKIC